MAEAANRRVGTYSKGMLQRIGLAQAIVHDPQLVILDEPTAGVDPLGSAAIADIIRELKDRGKTILFRPICSRRSRGSVTVWRSFIVVNWCARGALMIWSRIEMRNRLSSRV